MNPATISGSKIDIVVAKWIVAAVGDGISFLIKVRLSFVVDRLIFASLQLPGTQCKHFAGCRPVSAFKAFPHGSNKYDCSRHADGAGGNKGCFGRELP